MNCLSERNLIAYKYDPLKNDTMVIKNILNGIMWNVTEHKVAKKHINQGKFAHIHICISGEYISVDFIDDNIANCLSGDDETNMTCYFKGNVMKGSFCRTSCSKPLCQCDILYYQRMGGGCYPFKSKCNFSCFETFSKSTYLGFSNKYPGKNIVNLNLLDSIIKADCTAEELKCHDYNKSCFSSECRKKDEIQCIYGCKKCFPFYKLCVYELDFNGNLMHCSSGSHLANCRVMQCNNMFKCFNYYCIPYRYDFTVNRISVT